MIQSCCPLSKGIYVCVELCSAENFKLATVLTIMFIFVMVTTIMQEYSISAPLRACMNESKGACHIIVLHLHVFCVMSQIGNVFRQQVYLCHGALRLQLYRLQEYSISALL